jgi:hypothetical protein
VALFAAVHESGCGTKRKWRDVRVESDMRGEADIPRQNLSVHY